MSRSHIELTDRLSVYLRSVSLREPELLHRLRDQSPSLADFVVRVREITSVPQLRLAAG